MEVSEEVSAFAAYGDSKKKSGKGKKNTKKTPPIKIVPPAPKNGTKNTKKVPKSPKVNDKPSSVNDTSKSTTAKKRKAQKQEDTSFASTPKSNGIGNGNNAKKPKLNNKKATNSTKKSKGKKPNVPQITVDTVELSTKGTSPLKSTPQKTIPATALKLEPLSPNLLTIPRNNSVEEGLEVFKWLLSSIDENVFFKKFWEQSPCLIKRDNPAYYSNLISFEAIDQMLLQNHVEFTKNIDVTSYKNGVRETLNPEGRALPPVIWDHYADGCSIRLLNPQTFIRPIYLMNTTLQEFFHCMVGTNAYLTPPNSQGFAPHYDDIEAFVLQIEGQKRWKLYNPRVIEEQLPRFSSKNFSQDEIGEPVLDEVLKPGDLLYFPRGTIHQACTQPGHHSLHITLSLYQKHSYADLFEILLPTMLSRAIQQDVELRRGLPLNLWRDMGVVNSDLETPEREEILQKCQGLLQRVLSFASIDEAVDQMAKRFQHDALPPEITPREKVRTVFGSRTVVNSQGEAERDFEVDLNTRVRLLRANIVRLVEEEDKIRIYYYVDNSKEYHEYEPNFIEIETESANAVDHLIKCYPEYISVEDLQCDSDEVKLSVVQGLWERGLLMTDVPIPRSKC